MSAQLPKGFAALEPFAERWAGATAAERADLRAAHAIAERDAFAAACAPLLAQGLARLDQTPLAEQDEAEQRLMRLLLTYAHVSLAAVQGPDEAMHARLRTDMRITRTPADV